MSVTVEGGRSSLPETAAAPVPAHPIGRVSGSQLGPQWTGERRGIRARARGRSVRFLLPLPASPGHALSVLIVGFAVEGTTEAYQFLVRGSLVSGPLEYYATLTTTILGFYLMFLGLREWHAFHPKPLPKGSVPGKLPRPYFGLALTIGAVGMTAALNLALGSGPTGGAPFWVAWPVGGVVVLAFGRFFFGLREEAQLLGSASGNALGWAAFAWSLGVATFAGLVVGDSTFQLLTELATNWVALIASLGPVVVAMSPLFVTYALMIGAYWSTRRKTRFGSR
jgi:hypothetical protein